MKEIIEVSIDGKNWKEWDGTLWELIYSGLYPFVRVREIYDNDTSTIELEVSR